jgi:hypothetical protein
LWESILVLPWLWVLWRFRDQRNYMDLARIPSGWKFFVMDFASDRRYLHHFDRRALLHVVTVLAGLGAFRAWREGNRGALAFAAAALCLLLCAYAFAYSSFLDQTEPYRYLATYELFAFVPGSLGLRELFRLAVSTDRAGRLVALWLALMFAPALTSYGFDLRYRWGHPHHAVEERRMAAVRWLQANAGENGRILTDDKGLGNVLPYYVKREVIGGTIGDESVLPHAWCGAGPFGLFGPRLRGVLRSQGRLAGALQAYNIAYVVTRDAGMVADLQALPGVFQRSERLGDYWVFETDTTRLGFVAGREGTNSPAVIAGPNRIVVRNAPSGTFLLKYHYMQGLCAQGDVMIRPAAHGDDPVPFIEVRNDRGQDTVEIGLEY